MAGGIFLIRDDGKLVQFTTAKYETEDVLQTYVEQYPDLLAGDLIDAEVPRRWVLVQRESPLASDEGGAARWSVDHVFLDQDAVPTLVEVKRSSDTRIRREVIGQMMEYAAHAVLYWPVEKMRAAFESTCATAGASSAERLAALLALDDDASLEDEVANFWARAKENLEQGHLRLLFVADVFPAETKRIIEFLNEKMSDIEVLAVEIRQFTGDGQPILVPRLYGQTEVTRQRKAGPRSSRRWDEASYFAAMQGQHPELLDATRMVYDWAAGQGLSLTWGTGVETGSVSLRTGPTEARLASLLTDGRIEFAFAGLREPFDDLDRRRELVARFAAIEGFVLPGDAEVRYPSVPLALLNDGSLLERFLEAVSYWVTETTHARPAAS